MPSLCHDPKLPAASLRWYRILSDISPIGIFFTDADGNCIHVNSRWCEIAGLTPAQAMNTGWLQAIHEEDRERVSKKWYDSARSNAPFHLEYRFNSRDKVTWVIGDARAISTEEGDIWGYIGTITAIDETYRKFEQAREVVNRINSIVNHLPLVFFAIDHKNRVRAWNHEAERVTGYSFKEMINSKDVLENIFESPEFLNEVLSVDDNQELYTFNHKLQLQTKSDDAKTVIFTDISRYHPIPEWKFWCVGIDITERIDAENKLHERIKELNCLYRLSILKGQSSLNSKQFLHEVVDILPAAMQYPEKTTARIIYGNEIFKSTQFKKSPWRLSSDIFVRGEKSGLIEIYYTREMPTRDEGPFLNEERLLIDEIAVQVSRKLESIQSEKDLRVLEELSAKANELEQFSHTVTHDLKVPLTGISGYSQFLAEAYKNGDHNKVNTCIETIEKICNDMSQRLDEILQLAKIGKIINPDSVVDLNSLIFDIIVMLEQTFQKAGITISVDNDFPSVIGDRLRLAEVFENLLDNAVKYIGTGKKKIHVGWQKIDSELTIFVRDTGIGIDPRNLDIVFQLFKQLDKTADGDGTGLAICKRIIEAHRGRIWVESDGVGQGSRFCFVLPQYAD